MAEVSKNTMSISIYPEVPTYIYLLMTDNGLLRQIASLAFSFLPKFEVGNFLLKLQSRIIS